MLDTHRAPSCSTRPGSCRSRTCRSATSTTSLLERTDHTTHCPFKGDASYWTRAGRRPRCSRTRSGRTRTRCRRRAGCAGYAALYWKRADAWFVEEEPVFGAPARPLPPRRRARELAPGDGDRGRAGRRALRAAEAAVRDRPGPARVYVPRADVAAGALARGGEAHASARTRARRATGRSPASPTRRGATRRRCPEAIKVQGHVALRRRRRRGRARRSRARSCRRPPQASNRSGSNGAGSTTGGSPAVELRDQAAGDRAERDAGALVAGREPEARARRATGPIAGRWSGSHGRSPAHAAATGSAAGAGTGARRARPSRRSPRGRRAVSNPRRSREEPTSTSPSHVVSTTVESSRPGAGARRPSAGRSRRRPCGGPGRARARRAARAGPCAARAAAAAPADAASAALHGPAAITTAPRRDRARARVRTPATRPPATVDRLDRAPLADAPRPPRPPRGPARGRSPAGRTGGRPGRGSRRAAGRSAPARAPRTSPAPSSRAPGIAHPREPRRLGRPRRRVRVHDQRALAADPRLVAEPLLQLAVERRARRARAPAPARRPCRSTARCPRPARSCRSRPRRGRAASTATPRTASSRATAAPTMPAPTTTTSVTARSPPGTGPRRRAGTAPSR